MARFLGSLFETKKANPKEAGIRAAGRAMSNGGQALGVAGPWDLDKAVKDGLERVSHVFRCVDAIAQTQARIPMELRQQKPGTARGTAKTVDDEDIWKLLNFRSNSYESAMQFRYRLSAVLLLSRRGAFVEMVKGQGGKVTELHIMQPGAVEPIPDPKTFVSGYKIMRGDYVIDEVEPERVCWIKTKPHPSDPYSQLTPLMAAGLAIETDFLARAFNRNFLANDGRPGMLISVKGDLNPEDAAEMKARFSGGVAQAGMTSVIEADEVTVADLAANPRDLQWLQMLQGTKEDILLSFGVPESVMGNASGRTFDNADAERENFYIDTIQPHCDPIAFGLDPITGDTDDDVVVAYDYSTVDVLQRIANRKREEYRTEVGAGLRTIDSYFEAIGEPPLNVPGSRVLFTPAGLAIGTESDVTAVAAMPLVGSGAQTDPAKAAEQGALGGIRKGIAEGDRQKGNTDQANSVRQRALTLVKSFELESGYETKDDDKRVSWNYAGSRAAGSVQSVHTKPITITSKGKKVTRNGTPDDPAFVIEADNGSTVVKLRSECSEAKALPSAPKRRRNTAGHTVRREAQHPYMGLRMKMEGMLEGHLTQWDARQENVVADRLTHMNFRKDTRHWTEYKALPKEQKCKYCKEQATVRVIHSEGRAYVPACDDHLKDAKDAAATCTPDGSYDASNIDAVREIKSTEIQYLETKTVGETKAVNPKYAVDEKKWTDDLMDGMGDFIQKAMLREAKTALANMKNDGMGPYVSLPNTKQLDNLLDPHYQEVMDIVRTAAKNQVIRLQKAIAEADEQGKSLKEIESVVRKMMGTRAPWRKQLSVNVVTTAVEAARHVVHNRAGDLYTKTWVSEQDARVRHTHVVADGQTRPANRPFRVGGAKLMRPGDPTAPIQEIVNCRCWAEYSPSAKFYALQDGE